MRRRRNLFGEVDTSHLPPLEEKLQQKLTLLAERSFLDCQLEPDAELRRAQCLYLLETLPGEVPAVSVMGGLGSL
ncbi:MAG: hypothetical protein O7F73_18480 [Gammaproteobacteria bacterium]|nr:hypothetical protein [Gammaproteobacteria bacterium]